MDSWLIDGYDGIDKLRRGTVPDPTPGRGEVVLRVRYAALNPADYYLAEGFYPAKPPMPHVLGRDGMGTVTAVGEGVDGVKVGDERVVLRGEAGVTEHGLFAELVKVPADRLVPVPDGWSPQQAAAAPLVYLTAWQALTQFGDPPAGSVVLVTGATGGVGVATVQLAKGLGHTVVGLSRSAEKRDELKQLGCDHPLPADADGRAIKDAAGPVDLAVDNVGGAAFNEVVAAMNDRGRVSCVGMLAGPVPTFNTAKLFFRRLRIGGVAVGTFTAEESTEAWQRIVGLGVRPVIDREFGFDALPAAFGRLKEGPMGKVLVRVSP